MLESRKRPESPNTNSTSGTSSRKNRSVRTDRSSEDFFVSTVARGAGSGIRTHEGVTPNGCRVLALIFLRSRGRRFNHSAIPAWSGTRMPVLNHFRNRVEPANFSESPYSRTPCRNLAKSRVRLGTLESLALGYVANPRLL